ncbi:hypothetical protein, partial [Nonomuraea sp. NPDC050691]
KDPELRRTHRDAARVRRTWMRLARYLRLSLRDDIPTVRDAMFSDRSRAQQPKIRVPRIRRIDNDVFGVTIDFVSIPGVGLEEFVKACDHLANHWRMTRVSAHQPEPGLIRVRAVRRDPLTIALAVGTPRNPGRLDYFPAGLDEYGEIVKIRLKNSSGIGVYGLPGYGKTSFILGLISYFALSPAVQFIVCDGKVETGLEGDYQDVADRCAVIIGDDIATFNALLKQLRDLRRMRSSTIRQTLGTPNVWDVGPSAAWPLIILVIDECHTYFQQVKDGGNPELKKRNSMAAENVLLVEDLGKKGRSVGIIPVPATQKSTGEAIPTQIRDVMTTAISFAVRTEEAAVAALGADIKNWPDAHPLTFLSEEYIGVASMVAAGRPGFTRFRSPHCRSAVAAAISEQAAHLVEPETLPGVTIGQAHRAIAPGTAAALLPDLGKITD